MKDTILGEAVNTCVVFTLYFLKNLKSVFCGRSLPGGEIRKSGAMGQGKTEGAILFFRDNKLSCFQGIFIAENQLVKTLRKD
jgi:hypothetical protein